MAKPRHIETTGRVEKDGTLKIWNRNRFNEDIKLLSDCSVEIIVKRKVKSRSSNQMGYYFGVIVPMVREGLRDIGYVWDNQTTDKFLREGFFYDEVVNPATGTIFKKPLSLKEADGEITTVRMMEICDEIIKYAAMELSVFIPEPNSQSQMFDEKYYEKQNEK